MMAKRLRQGTPEEWQSFAGDFRKIRGELSDLLKKHQGLLPARGVDRYIKILHAMDSFKCAAEDVMYQRNGPMDLKIWFGWGKE